MPNPLTPIAAVLVAGDGKVVADTCKFFATRVAARDGCKDMLRKAPDDGHSVAIFTLTHRLDLTTTYKLVDL